ncbi:MAG: CHAP and LysM peptidoglycan-binding domain-containing protein, partial [bacterium]
MTENELRQKVASVMLGWVGGARGGAEHREILALYNARRPLPRGYALGERDAYCAAAVSAAWIKAGCDVLGLVPIECSCGMMLRLAKGAGLWREEDGYLPEVGDAVMYDWQDSG